LDIKAYSASKVLGHCGELRHGETKGRGARGQGPQRVRGHGEPGAGQWPRRCPPGLQAQGRKALEAPIERGDSSSGILDVAGGGGVEEI